MKNSVTLAMAILAVSAGLADAAQNAPLGVAQAPVGHRQPQGDSAPNERNLDADVRDPNGVGQTEKQREESKRAKKITRSICSNC